MLEIQEMAQIGFIRARTEQAVSENLQMEEKQKGPGQCLRGELGEGNHMVESPLGAHPQGPRQTFTRQGTSPRVSPCLGDCTLVATTADEATTNKGPVVEADKPDRHEWGRLFQDPEGKTLPPPRWSVTRTPKNAQIQSRNTGKFYYQLIV